MKSNPYIELREKNLAPYATRSSMLPMPCKTANRTNYLYRTPFEEDKEFVLHSNALKKLAGKSQNLIADFIYATTSRLTHTFQVATIASRIAKGLGLNSDLTEAIALGHDVGHLPFSHNAQISFNMSLTEQYWNLTNRLPDTSHYYSKLKNLFYISCEDEPFFLHQKQSFYIFHKIETPPERELTDFTKMGLLHNFKPTSFDVFTTLNAQAITFEMLVVALADDIAWTTQDISKALECGFLFPDVLYSHLSKNNHVETLLRMDTDSRFKQFIDDAIEFNLHHQRLERLGALKGQKIALSPIFENALHIMKEIVYEQILNNRIIRERADNIQKAVAQFILMELKNVHQDPSQEDNADGFDIFDKYRIVCDRLWALSEYQFIRLVENYDEAQSRALKNSLMGIAD